MTHDPLCPYVQVAHQRDHVACQCILIAKVREDALAAAVQRVEAMTPAIYTPIGHPHEGCPDPSRHMTWEPAFTIPDILAAIKGDHP